MTHSPSLVALIACTCIPRVNAQPEIVVGGWWDDVTDAVGDAASSAWDDTGGAAYDYAVQYAKEHPDQVGALATAAAVAAGTAIAGPAGGAIAGSIAGSSAAAAASGHDVWNAAQQAAQQAAEQAAQHALGITPDTHAALSTVAKNAFVHSALAVRAIHLTQMASAGDDQAQHALTQVAQAAASGSPTAQVMAAAAYHAAPAVSGYSGALAAMAGW